MRLDVLVVLTPPEAEPAVSTAGARVEARLSQRHVGPSRWRLICDWLLNKRQLGLQRGFLRAASLVLHLSFDTQKRSQVQVQPNGTSSRYRSVLTTLRTRDPQLYGGKTRRIKHLLNTTLSTVSKLKACDIVHYFCLLALCQNSFYSVGTALSEIRTDFMDKSHNNTIRASNVHMSICSDLMQWVIYSQLVHRKGLVPFFYPGYLSDLLKLIDELKYQLKFVLILTVLTIP